MREGKKRALRLASDIKTSVHVIPVSDSKFGSQGMTFFRGFGTSTSAEISAKSIRRNLLLLDLKARVASSAVRINDKPSFQFVYEGKLSAGYTTTRQTSINSARDLKEVLYHVCRALEKRIKAYEGADERRFAHG